jgi:hypothetical protein
LRAPGVVLLGAASTLTLEHVNGCNVPFSRLVVDPLHIEAMRAAFYQVCDALLLKYNRDDPMTEIIADKIVALAEAGEHDANRLAELVLNDLADDGLAAAE